MCDRKLYPGLSDYRAPESLVKKITGISLTSGIKAKSFGQFTFLKQAKDKDREEEGRTFQTEETISTGALWPDLK